MFIFLSGSMAYIIIKCSSLSQYLHMGGVQAVLHCISSSSQPPLSSPSSHRLKSHDYVAEYTVGKQWWLTTLMF